MDRYSIRQLQSDAATRPPKEQRPKTRGDCVDGPRPCPWVSCRYHLYLDVDPVKHNGSIKLNFPDIDPDGMTGRLESCALDVAEDGANGFERVAELMNVTREAVRLIENRATAKIRLPMARELELDEDEQ